MPKEPRDRVLRDSTVPQINEVSSLAVFADLIDIDVLRAEPHLVPREWEAVAKTFTPDEWEELQAGLRDDHSMLVGCLRRSGHERLLRDPDTPRQRR